VNLGKRSKWYMPLPAIQAFFFNIYSLTSKVCFNEKNTRTRTSGAKKDGSKGLVVSMEAIGCGYPTFPTVIRRVFL